MPVELLEFVDNPEPRCPVILLCNTSDSMSGAPISTLNAGLAAFKEDVCQDQQASLRVEVALITSSPMRLAQEFVTIDNFIPPKLKADGVTQMNEAIEYALDLLEERKEIYKNTGIQYYRPWVFLITDGSPIGNWHHVAQRIRQAELQRQLLFFATGVQDADMDTLKQIAPPERPPVLLHGLDFKSMFQWLSISMKRVSTSQAGGAMIELPPVGWGQITA